MTGYRTIVAYLSDADTAPSTLELAFLVGRHQSAHVEALHIRIDPASALPLVGEGMSAAMVQEMLAAAERQADERATRIRAQFEETCQRLGVPRVTAPPAPEQLTTAWHESGGREEEIVANIGRLTDLLVMPRPIPDRDTPSIMTLNAALMESGRAVLLAPPAAPLSLGQNIAIFWNGSAEASRAVMAAMPFLERASHVSILSAREEEAAVPAELAGYLAWHNIQANVDSFVAGHQVGQTLLDEAARRGADMVVMGAYTHSRLRQLILGGVTRHVLHAATLPVLLCH
jgi:nucleotide-binding universal stress UspA family protein